MNPIRNIRTFSNQLRLSGERRKKPRKDEIFQLIYSLVHLIFTRSDSLIGVCVSDHNYPNRVAHTLLTKILDDFSSQVIRIKLDLQ